MTKMRKTRAPATGRAPLIVRTGGAKAQTNGAIVGSPEIDLVSLFRQG